MARLPDPQMEGMEIIWGQGYKELQSSFFGIIGQAIRNKNKEDKKKGEEKEDKD